MRPRTLDTRKPRPTSEEVTAKTGTSCHHSTVGQALHLSEMSDVSSAHPPPWWLYPQTCTPESTT